MTRKKPLYIIFSWTIVMTLIGLACGLGTSEPPASPATMAAATVQAVLSIAATDTAATATALASIVKPTSEQPTATNTPDATNTPTPTVEPTISAPITVNFAGASFTIPAGLASQARSELVPAKAFNGDSPFEPGNPASVKFSLDGYPLTGKFFEPNITIMPADLYGRIYNQSKDTFAAMRDLLNTGTPKGPSVPFLPVFNAAQVFRAQFKMLPSLAGKGYRFVTKYAQDASPVTNSATFYTYQGLSSDGQYFITVIMPVTSVILPETIDGVTPPGGVAAPALTDPDYGNKYSGYITQLTAALDGLASDKYTPNLDQLDAMVSSISLNTVTGLIPGCPGLLTVGGKAYVSLDPPVSNNLRSGPSKKDKVVGSIVPGTLVEILNGPTCADGLVYWQVRVPSQNITAYTAESDFKEQWLMPCPTAGSCP